MNYESDREIRNEALSEEEPSATEGETHATTGGAAAAGAVTGGVIGLTGGPVGAAIGAVGGAIVGAAAERMMHSDDGGPTQQTAHVDEPPVAPFTTDDMRTEVDEPVGEPLAELPDKESRPIS